MVSDRCPVMFVELPYWDCASLDSPRRLSLPRIRKLQEVFGQGKTCAKHELSSAHPGSLWVGRLWTVLSAW